MHLKGLIGHVALGIDILMIGFSGWNVIPQFNSTYFNDSISLIGIQARGFSIQNNFTHPSPPLILPIYSPLAHAHVPACLLKLQNLLFHIFENLTIGAI